MLLAKKIVVFVSAFAMLFVLSAGTFAAAADPSVAVSDQVATGGKVWIDKIVAVQDGWVVIHAGDKAGTVMGFAPVKAGENDKVAVNIDMSKGTPTVSAMLHIDNGVVGTYEFPAADPPVKNAAGDVVNTPFKIIGVDVPDQFVKDTKAVMISNIVAQQDGWIVIHAGDKAGTVLGHAPIKAGLNSNVKVTLDDPTKVTEMMTAMIHIDAGKIGTYEFPGADTPPKMGAGISNEPFWTVDHVRAWDQKLAADGTFTVPSILATVDGYIVIHSTATGGPVLGHAAIKAGYNANVKVTIDTPAGITDQVSAMLHIDAGKIGTYEFPGPDAPVKDSAGQLINPLFSTTGQPVPDMTATMAAMADMSATAAATPK